MIFMVIWIVGRGGLEFEDKVFFINIDFFFLMIS